MAAQEEPHIITLPSELSETQLSQILTNLICRICVNQSDKLIGIYSEDGINNNLAGKINLYLPIKVAETDNLPLQCCWQCASTLLAWHELVGTSLEADRRLRSIHFVTEKQLEEISSTYNQTDNVLVNASAEETLNVEEEKRDPEETTKEINPTEANLSETEETESNMPDVSKTIYPYSNTCSDLPQLKCNICEKNFSAKLELMTHLKTVHFLKIPKIRRKKCDVPRNFQCPRCEKGYTKNSDLQRHLKIKHGQQINKRHNKNEEIAKVCKLTTKEGGESLYQCDICSKTFTKRYNLLRHHTIHEDAKAYCCSICGKSFRLNMSLTRHLNEVHKNTRKFSCDICKKEFKNKWSRDEHLNTHSNIRPYVCDICGKAFKQSASLHVHKRYHSKDLKFECNICCKKFRSKHNLERHFLIHSNAKPFECGECNVRFNAKQSLVRHNEKCHLLLFCEKCGSRFEQMRHLKLHRKSCTQRVHVATTKSEGVIIKNTFCSVE